jgi:hypothetical protein
MALDEATNPVRGVSGPGKFAKRTDLQVQSTGYGDKVAYDANKSAAPLATAQKSPLLSQAPEVPTSAPAQQPVTSLYEPTQRPDEPITHGVDIGAGGGSDALSMPAQVQNQYTNAYDTFQAMAANPNASPTMKYLAQRIQLGF